MKLEKPEARGSRGRRSGAVRGPRILRPGQDPPELSWQLEMFRFSLKKQQKLGLLLELLGPLEDERCLLITNGDNPGSLNYHLREWGGTWSWVELEEAGIPQMEALLGDEVRHGRPDALPFGSGVFDRVVVVDVHEHLTEVAALNAEISRVLAPEGVAILTTPSGDTSLPLSRVKRWVGMGPEVYGHTVQGYTTEQLEEMVTAVGLRPLARGAYARFFTEFAELVINFGYVKVLGKGAKKDGEIAPRTAADLKSVGTTYRVYRRVYPVIRAFSSLDRLVARRDGYAVAIAAMKDG